MKQYITLFIVLLITEIAIAVFHFHYFIRGFVGDVLVIPLLYCLLQIITPWRSKVILYGVLCMAMITELLQWLIPSEVILAQHEIIQTLCGTTFDVKDILAYIIGIIPVLFIDKYIIHQKNKKLYEKF